MDSGLNMKFAYDDPDNVLRAHLRYNTFRFGAAKSMSMIKDIQAVLLDDDGKPRSFNDFKAEVLKIDEQYNTNWLRTEYNHALGQSQNASNWLQFEKDKDIYPNLRYQTIEDDRVRPEHDALNGIVRPVDDPIWNTIAPKNDWGCRCTLIQEDADTEITDKEESVGRMKAAKIPKSFKSNPGKDRIIWDDGLPYFVKAGGKVKSFKAVDYGLETVQEIYNKPSKLSKYKGSIKSEEDYNKWWQKQVEANRTGTPDQFTLKSKATGYHILFDEKLKKKPFSETRKSEKRHLFADEIPDLVNDPDEVFTVLKSSKKLPDKLITTYIRYYDDQAVVLIVEEKGELMKALSYYKVKPTKGGTIDDLRRGLLEYNKTRQK